MGGLQEVVHFRTLVKALRESLARRAFVYYSEGFSRFIIMPSWASRAWEGIFIFSGLSNPHGKEVVYEKEKRHHHSKYLGHGHIGVHRRCGALY